MSNKHVAHAEKLQCKQKKLTENKAGFLQHLLSKCHDDVIPVLIHVKTGLAAIQRRSDEHMISSIITFVDHSGFQYSPKQRAD